MIDRYVPVYTVIYAKVIQKELSLTHGDLILLPSKN